jgi:zinc transporter, ZIP family
MVDYTDSFLGSLMLTMIVSLLVASPFLIASIISKEYRHPLRLRADLASFSAGIFIGAVTFSIIEESIKLGDIFSMGIGFAIGAVTFSLVRYKIQNKPVLATNEDKQNGIDSSISHPNNNHIEKKRNHNQKEIQTERTGSGKLIVIGTLTDSHPETIMIGVMIALGIPGLFPTALALFIGNFAATIVGTRELIAENESKRQILQKWVTVFIFVTIGGPIGYFLTLFLNEYYLSIVFSFAAGALMSFVTEELIPDAYRKVNWHIGLSACVGLFVSIAIFHFFH